MAVSDRYIDELCVELWNGTVCPHGIDHAVTSNKNSPTCLSCLQYAVTSKGEEKCNK